MAAAYAVTNANGVVQTVDPVPYELRREQGYRLVSKVGLSIAYDTRNSVLLPDRGQRTVFSTELAGGPFGGDSDFYKLELSSARFIRGFFPGHVLELGARGGVLDTYSNTARVPLYDRFYLGGMWDLRGYKFHHVGPRDGQEPVGGNTYWFGTAEYSLPIIERLRLAVFYDIGNVYKDAYSFATQDPGYGPYSDNWGVGIRLNIPGLGPLRLDYAIPLTHDSFNGGAGRFQFGIGFTREY
jgi:outer membrane protein insertion porin family